MDDFNAKEGISRSKALRLGLKLRGRWVDAALQAGVEDLDMVR